MNIANDLRICWFRCTITPESIGLSPGKTITADEVEKKGGILKYDPKIGIILDMPHYDKKTEKKGRAISFIHHNMLEVTHFKPIYDELAKKEKTQ